MQLHFNELAQSQKRLDADQAHLIWVPSSAIVVHEVQAPKAPKRKWPELLPWMLEEKLLQAPQDSHFIIASKQGEQLTVLVTAKSQIREWQQSISSAGASNYSLLPDFLALPWHSGLISIARQEEQILVRYGELQGFAAPAELAWLMLRKLDADSVSPRGLAVCLPETDLLVDLQARVEVRHGEPDWQQAAVLPSANLLQGEFSLQQSAGMARAWLATAALLVLSIGLGFLSLHLENRQLAAEVEQLADSNRSEFYRQFPGLSIQSGNIRQTLESFISDRFRQRASLEQVGMRVLQDIDSVLSACNCSLQGLQWTAEGLELSLPLSAAERVEDWQFATYTKQSIARADDGLTVMLRPEYD